jgi:cobalt/nickel transport system ATP-binding protein
MSGSVTGSAINAIEAESISYTYPDGTTGFRDVSLKIGEGERVAIIGANGSGKSTLLMVLSGLLKPKTGRVRIYGIEPNKKSVEKIRRMVGVVFQDPDDFLFNPTVRDELIYAPLQLDWTAEEIERAVREYSQIFNLHEILHKPPFRLSGGEKKKVEIASVLIARPRILFLDEPTANIDGKARRKIMELLKDFDGTLVLTSHELDVARKLCGRAIIMGMDRKIVAEGDIGLLDDVGLLEDAGVL